MLILHDTENEDMLNIVYVIKFNENYSKSYI